MDFLSALIYYEKQASRSPVIVLNSASLKARAVDAIRETGAERVYLYLDQDRTGRKLTRYFRDHLPGVIVSDCADLYLYAEGCKDFNDYLVATRNTTSRSR